MSSHPDSRPLLTERDASRLEAEAGIAGRVAAQNAGGDPKQISAMMRAAGQGGVVKAPVTIGGVPLYDMCLAVSVAHGAMMAHPCAQTESRPLVLARLAYILHAPIEAHQRLSSGLPEDLEDLDAEALALVGHWGTEEMAEFGKHLASMKAAAAPEEEVSLGKPPKKISRKPLRAGRGR